MIAPPNSCDVVKNCVQTSYFLAQPDFPARYRCTFGSRVPANRVAGHDHL